MPYVLAPGICPVTARTMQGMAPYTWPGSVPGLWFWPVWPRRLSVKYRRENSLRGYAKKFRFRWCLMLRAATSQLGAISGPDLGQDSCIFCAQPAHDIEHQPGPCKRSPSWRTAAAPAYAVNNLRFWAYAAIRDHAGS
jgi:hypothetical protein